MWHLNSQKLGLEFSIFFCILYLSIRQSIKEINMNVEPQPLVVLDKPAQKVNNTIWTVVINSLSAVLIIAVLALALSMWIPPVAGGTSGQIMLTVFTTVVGFLGGLFTNSPTSGK
jgi:hypothetical protein